jgi:hypothetical protein
VRRGGREGGLFVDLTPTYVRVGTRGATSEPNVSSIALSKRLLYRPHGGDVFHGGPSLGSRTWLHCLPRDASEAFSVQPLGRS